LKKIIYTTHIPLNDNFYLYRFNQFR
jgi:hypothetical protein